MLVAASLVTMLDRPALATSLPTRDSTITLADCGSLRTEELARLLNLERSIDLAQLPRRAVPRVTITCGPKETIINLQDPLTRKGVTRVIPSPERWGPDSERLLAMATTSLMVASWAELLVQREQQAPGPPRQVLDPVRAHVREALRKRIVPAEATSPWALTVAMGGRARQLSRPLWLWHGQLRLARDLSDLWQLFARVEAETGQTSRLQGHVDALLVGGAVGLALRLPLGGHFFAGASLGVGGVYGKVTGRAGDSDLVASTADGAAAQLSASTGIWWQARSIRIGLMVEGGGTLPSLTGEVRGDDDVMLGGAWVGGTLQLGLAF